MDWRILFGLVVTSVWLLVGVLYLSIGVGWTNFSILPTGEIGSFLEGAFAPLAFLWLVIGHFMQQKEISANTQAIQVQELSARRLERHAERESYLKLLTLVQDQLGNIAGFHYMSICGPTGTGEVSTEEFASMRSTASSSDHALFIRKMISLAANNREKPELLQEFFFGTEIRSRHSDNFRHTFSKLLKRAKAVDTDDMLTNALLSGSASGLLYQIILRVSGDESRDPITGIAESATSSGRPSDIPAKVKAGTPIMPSISPISPGD